MQAEKAQCTQREIPLLVERAKRRRAVLGIFLGYVLYALSINCLMARRTSDSGPISTDALTLGFALTPTYGIVAVHDNEGHLLATGKVDGDEQYVRTMQRLSDPSSRHISPPQGSFVDGIVDWPRQALRRARKTIGLPATADVGSIATLVSQLIHSVEPKVPAGRPYGGAILALPNVIALYEEDACDILSYLSIKDLVGTHIAESHPRAIDAAFTGYGFKNCHDWRDRDACKRDFASLPFWSTLLVDYSRGALTVMVDRLRSGAGVSKGVVVDFDAGSGSQAGGEDQWRRLSEHIHNTVDGSLWKSVDVVLLTGESAVDEAFQEALERAVEKYGSPRIYSSDPEYVPVKAASEMAWQAAEIRRLYPNERYFPCPAV